VVVPAWLGSAVARLDLLPGDRLLLAGSRELLGAALRLSPDLKHQVCGCVYLALAIERDIPLVTADRKLSGAVRSRRKLASQVRLLEELPLE
jgi:predicted nucleic acid-binding protein